jgi:hypothetical protein
MQHKPSVKPAQAVQQYSGSVEGVEQYAQHNVEAALQG